MRLEGTPQEFAALALELQNPQIKISDDAVVRTTKRFFGFDQPLGKNDAGHTNRGPQGTGEEE